MGWLLFVSVLFFFEITSRFVRRGATSTPRSAKVVYLLIAKHSFMMLSRPRTTVGVLSRLPRKNGVGSVKRFGGRGGGGMLGVSPPQEQSVRRNGYRSTMPRERS